MTPIDIEALDAFLAQFPIYEYRLIDPGRLKVAERVRVICTQECTRYNTTWACPPAVGSLEECQEKVHGYETGFFFSSVSEVSDLMNMEEMLAQRHGHEALTDQLCDWFRDQGYEVFSLSTESCDICEHCAWPEGKPCRFPERMHPCIESYGLVVSEIAEEEEMAYDIGGNTILWFSLVLLR